MTVHPFKTVLALHFNLFAILALATGCVFVYPVPVQAQNPTPLQTCTVTNIRGQPLTGTFCGGSSTGGNRTFGALYKCDNKTSVNNCTSYRHASLDASLPIHRRVRSHRAATPAR